MAQKQPVGMAVAKFDYRAVDLHELNINKGEKLTLVDDTQHWWQVMNSKGETGYVPSNYCKKSKQGLFSSLKNTLGRKKNKDSPHPASCSASSVGTAPSGGGGKRSVTASPNNVNLSDIASPELINNGNTNDNSNNKQKYFENCPSNMNNANPFYSMGSLKSNGSNKLIQKPSQSMSYNAGHNISISSDNHNQSQPILPAQILPHYQIQKVPSSESQFHSSVVSHASSNQQFNGREYFGSGGSKSKLPHSDGLVEPCVDRFRQDSRMIGGEGGMLFPNNTGSLGPVSVCVAKFSYSPCQPDELALSRGDRIKVLEKSSDGWWRGELINNTSMLSAGWFPSNYVTLERPQHNNTFRSNTDSLGRQRTGPGMPVSSQLHSSMPSVTSGIESTCIVSNHHGDNVEKWSGPNKLHPLQRFSTVLTLYPFSKNQPEEMSFDANEILEVLDRPIDDPDWWRCRNVNGDIGLVPRNYVKQLTSTGALISKQQQPPQQQSTIIDQKQCTISNDSGENIRLSFNRTGRFKDRIWYWGAISRVECESLLMNSGYLGQFVVRDSESHPGDLTITMHASTKCRNFKVHLQNNEYHIGQKVFSNVESLIQHYRTHPIYKSDSERLFLTDPFQYKTPLSSF